MKGLIYRHVDPQRHRKEELTGHATTKFLTGLSSLSVFQL